MQTHEYNTKFGERMKIEGDPLDMPFRLLGRRHCEEGEAQRSNPSRIASLRSQ